MTGTSYLLIYTDCNNKLLSINVLLDFANRNILFMPLYVNSLVCTLHTQNHTQILTQAHTKLTQSTQDSNSYIQLKTHEPLYTYTHPSQIYILHTLFRQINKPHQITSGLLRYTYGVLLEISLQIRFIVSLNNRFSSLNKTCLTYTLINNE